MATAKKEWAGGVGWIDYRHFYERHYGYLLRVAYRYCETYEDAVEVTQQGMLTVFRELKQMSIEYLSDENWVLDWMKQQVIVRCLEKSFVAAARAIDGSTADDAAGNSIRSQVAIRQDERLPIEDLDALNDRHLIELLRRLPRNHRMAYNLIVIDRYPMKMVTGLMSIDRGTASALVSAAREQFRKWLGS
ncbi:RNA polymerase sigma factor [Puia sp.]|jgi:RNA polymerase sigma factor (sigma-70 family)|uniref:RNA polymerase sigma factor n=1 Tax=Puia sp. TaxID=2045100 RepID=UPI002F41A7CA